VLRSALGSRSVPARALEALSTLVGTPIVLAPDALGPALETTLASDAITLRLTAHASANGLAPWWVVLEVEPALALLVVARLTKRPPPQVVAAGALSPNVVGAFMGILAAAMRRAGVPVVVSDVGAAFGHATVHADASVAAFTVLAEDQATHLKVVYPAALLASAPTLFGGRDLATLGSLPLDLPVVACRMLATTADIAALAEGDAWMLGDAWKLGRPNGTLVGPVWLCAGSSDVGLAASLEADGRLVLRDGVLELGWSPMEEETEESRAIAEAVGEVPVVVRVEIGSARMKAKEWSALATGDVVGLGSKVGGTVVLRVSGMAVAEGELVDIEGEVGVRIRKRLTGNSK
jgi:flagellar motor switch/type III secretory pathway protein FliN